MHYSVLHKYQLNNINLVIGVQCIDILHLYSVWVVFTKSHML